MSSDKISFTKCITLIWWTLFNQNNATAFHKAIRNGATEKEAFDYANAKPAEIPLTIEQKRAKLSALVEFYGKIPVSRRVGIGGWHIRREINNLLAETK